MLAKANRVRSSADFRATVRSGVRGSSSLLLAYAKRTGTETTRFGFITSKKVGNAVVRNRIRRQLRAEAHSAIASIPRGWDIVYRVLPSAGDSSYAELGEAAVSSRRRALEKAMKQHPVREGEAVQ